MRLCSTTTVRLAYKPLLLQAKLPAGTDSVLYKGGYTPELFYKIATAFVPQSHSKIVTRNKKVLELVLLAWNTPRYNKALDAITVRAELLEQAGHNAWSLPFVSDLDDYGKTASFYTTHLTRLVKNNIELASAGLIVGALVHLTTTWLVL